MRTFRQCLAVAVGIDTTTPYYQTSAALGFRARYSAVKRAYRGERAVDAPSAAFVAAIAERWSRSVTSDDELRRRMAKLAALELSLAAIGAALGVWLLTAVGLLGGAMFVGAARRGPQRREQLQLANERNQALLPNGLAPYVDPSPVPRREAALAIGTFWAFMVVVAVGFSFLDRKPDHVAALVVITMFAATISLAVVRCLMRRANRYAAGRTRLT